MKACAQKILARIAGQIWLLTMACCWLVGLSAWSVLAAETPAPAERPASSTLDTDPHLVSWWKFDETSGKTAADSSKQGHHATLDGALSFETHSTTGRVGRAIQLDGDKDLIKVPGYKGITGPQARTVAAWIKTPASGGEIVSWGEDDFGKMWTLGHIRGRIGVTPKGGYLYMKAWTRDDAWHHVAVVVQPASPPNLHDHVKLFRDGEPAEIDDIGLLDLWPIETGNKLDVAIGRRYKGLLDDLRVYDRALSEDEVQALFKLQTDRTSTKP